LLRLDNVLAVARNVPIFRDARGWVAAEKSFHCVPPKVSGATEAAPS